MQARAWVCLLCMLCPVCPLCLLCPVNPLCLLCPVNPPCPVCLLVSAVSSVPTMSSVSAVSSVPAMSTVSAVSSVCLPCPVCLQEMEETWKKSFLDAMEKVNEIPFVLHHVTTKFNSTAAFSDASFQLAAYAPNGSCLAYPARSQET